MQVYSTYHDAELVVFLQKNDEKAFGEIYDRYWEKLFAIAFHYSQQKSLAEEIVQDVFMTLWDRRDKVIIQSLSSYLATAAKFSVFASLKKELNRRKIVQQLPSSSADFSESYIHARFLKNYINDQVKALPEQCRIVYTYSRDEQLSIAQIAERMQLSPKTVENHLGRALRIIRKEIKQAWFWQLILLSFLHR